jgi:Mrp family chromosome partitioning ATPase
VGGRGETRLLGQIADGVILVLDERRTRRATAREAKAVLQAANARLLGVVINERQFPIPESIYRKL